LAKYKDLDLDFIKHPTTGDVSTKTDAEAVKRSVRQLVLTNKYERPFQPFLHSGVRALLFEPLSPITAYNIRQQIIDVITRYEPRAKLMEVQVIADEDRNSFEASIYFRVINIPEPIVLNLTLKRLR
jgi:phage baseplate assembly protein W